MPHQKRMGKLEFERLVCIGGKSIKEVVCFGIPAQLAAGDQSGRYGLGVDDIAKRICSIIKEVDNIIESFDIILEFLTFI